MKAAVLYEFGSPFVVEEVELRGPAEHEVLVRAGAAGVCHSDVHVAAGHWEGLSVPLVGGHECAGVVEKVGRGVTMVKPGDHILTSWWPNCGQCFYCLSGRPNLCDNPVQLSPATSMWKNEQKINIINQGGFAEYFVVPEAAAIPIKKEVPMHIAAVMGCAVMTGVGAVMNTAKVRPGATVAVFGCGGVGLNVIQGACLCGAARIIGVDLADDKLVNARGFGLTDSVNAAKRDPVEAVKELTGGAGVDYAFEAIGNFKAIEQAVNSLRKGGLAVVVGVPANRNDPVRFPYENLNGERTITGSLYGSANMRIDFPRLVDLYLSGKLDLDRLVTRKYHLDEINQAFSHMLKGQVGRGVIVFD